jgi:phage shock protein PspC (stress-responsive transcriptional regulator)
MYCNRCGVALEERDRYCFQCGASTSPALPRFSGRKLMLCREGKKIGGVCTGVARYFEVDPTLVRIVWLALVFVPPTTGLWAYAIAWLLMPNDDAPRAVSTSSPSPAF